MQRSGSTFSFNIARELLKRRGRIYQESFPDILPVIGRSNNANHVLLKAHSADAATIRLVQLGAVKVVCTVRKPEDAVASWIETFGFSLDDALMHMHTWLEMFAQLSNYALVVHYHQINSRPLRAACRIAHYLCPDAQLAEVAGITRAFSKRNVKALTDRLDRDGSDIQDIGFSYYDTKTFLHRNHVSTLASRSAAERIGSDSVAVIRRSLRPFTDDDGNLHNDGNLHKV